MAQVARTMPPDNEHDGRRLYTLMYGLGYDYYEVFTVYTADLLDYLKEHNADRVYNVAKSEEVCLRLYPGKTNKINGVHMVCTVRVYGRNGLREVMYRGNTFKDREYALNVGILRKDARKYPMYNGYLIDE